MPIRRGDSVGNRKFLRNISSSLRSSRIKRGVILLSGGIDSTVTLYFAKKYGYYLTALIFNYYQRHHREIEAAKKICNINRINYYIVRINIGWTKSSLTDPRIPVPVNRNLNKKEIPSTYVSARNIIFLSYAFSLAESIHAKKIFIGAHIQDYSGYPDCRPEFFDYFQRAVNTGMKDRDIEIVAPLVNKNKKEIIQMGLNLKVPFQYTWSCYKGAKLPCLKCDSCRFRISAFQELGITDPLLKLKGGG